MDNNAFKSRRAEVISLIKTFLSVNSLTPFVTFMPNSLKFSELRFTMVRGQLFLLNTPTKAASWLWQNPSTAFVEGIPDIGVNLSEYTVKTADVDDWIDVLRHFPFEEFEKINAGPSRIDIIKSRDSDND